MSLIRVIGFSMAAALFLACTDNGISAPPAGFTHAAATRTCGPADGPAVAIYLSPNAIESLEPTTPFVRIYVAEAVNILAGRTWSLAGSGSEGGAWFNASFAPSEVATRGLMTVSSVGSDNTVEGSVDLTFPSGHIHGGFHALWRPNNIVCV